MEEGTKNYFENMIITNFADPIGCENGFTFFLGSCTPCYDACESCHGHSYNQCDSCIDGLVLF